MDQGSDPKAARRKRVSRACDRCRSKKDKCDGLRPACSACQASGQTCSYDPNAKKRGLPEGYVRGLEKLWALALCNIDGFEDTMLSLLGPDTDSTSQRSRLMSLWADDSASETLHETWKSSRLFGALERMLSVPDVSSPQTQDKRRWDHLADVSPGLDGNWRVRIERSATPLGSDAPRVIGPSMPPNVKRARLSLSGVSTNRPDAAKSPNNPQLPSQTSQLLDFYFAVTHTWFPIVAKHNILRASYFYANSPTAVANVKPDSGDHAALWAILSYSVSQSKNTRGRSSVQLSQSREYYSVSRKLVPSEKERFELGHVQALLLLTLVNIGLEDWTAAWVLSGQAVRMAVAMGLGTYSGTERSDESRQGRAVFLGCFVIDSLLSFRLGRTTCMDPRDLTTVGHLEEDGLEEWNSWTDVLPPTRGLPSASPPQRGPLLSLSSFNRLVELASVLNKITRNLSGGPSAHVSAQQLLSELKQWDELLPLGCRLLGPESFYPGGQPTLLPHQTYLGLTYAATLLWLNLRIAPTEQGLQHSRRPATERAKKLLLRALPMISQHLENFQMCSFPPIFEVTLRTIAGQAFSLRDTTGVGSFPFTQWMQEFLQRTTELKDTWPVYGSLVSSIEHWQRAGRRSGTQRTPIGSLGLGNASPGGFSGSATMISDMRQMPHQEIQSEIPIHEQASNPLPQSLSSHAISTLMDRNYSATQDPGIGDLDLSMMDGRHQESTDRAPDLLDRLAQSDGPELVSPSAHERPVNSLSSAISPARTDQNMSSGSGLDLSTGAASNLNSPADAANDIDSIFKDLAYLDTTDWAIGREAGLKDFGFMDDTTFQAFCHDPDRLEGSQPLVHPSSIADIWPPPGFFPEAFQDNANETVDR